MCIDCSTHDADRFIPSRTDWPSSSNFFPFVTRSNARQTSAQATQVRRSVVRQPSNPTRVSIWSKSLKESKKHTLIVGRRALTEPKMALAGVMVEVFSARSRAPVAAFKTEIVLCRSLGG